MSSTSGGRFVAGSVEAGLEAARSEIRAGKAETVAEEVMTAVAGEASWRREAALERLRLLDVADRLLPYFRRGLHDEVDAQRRNAARSALTALASPDSLVCDAAAEVLTEIVKSDPDADARLLAAAVLGEAGNAAGRSTLESALEDDDPNVGSAAAESLGLLGDSRALPSLLNAAVAGAYWTRVAAVLALGRLKDARALPTLSAALHDPLLVAAAASSIGEIGGLESVELLRPVLAQGSEARRTALAAIAKIYGRNPDLIIPDWLRGATADHPEGLMDRVRQEHDPAAARLLGMAGTLEAADALVELAAHPDLASVAAVGIESLPAEQRVRLAMQHLETAPPPLRTILLDLLPPLHDSASIQKVVERLGDEEAETRAAAAQALGRSESDLVLTALSAALDVPGLRLGAAVALGRLGSERCEPLLAMLEDGSPEVRIAASDGLARCGIREASALLSLLEQEPEPRVKQAVIAALGEIGGTEVVSRLASLLDDPNPSLRFSAVRALGRAATDDAFEPLLRSLEDPVPEIRIAALNGLGDFGGSRAAAIVGGHLQETNREIRRTAARALDRIGGEGAVDQLLRTLDDDDREVRLTAIETIGRIGGSSVESALEARADIEPDAAVRNVASRTLVDLRERSSTPS